jgi:TolA-binding protein
MKRSNRGCTRLGAAVVPAILCGMVLAQARRTPGRRPSREEAVNVYAARSLLKKANDLLALGEKERGVKMLETIVKQYARTPVRYEAYLALGRHHVEQHDQARAITVLRHLNELKKPDEEPVGTARDLYLEGLYLTGMAYFQMKQYGAAFPVLRKITTSYPNTVWANQAFYYVGMCHFAQGNWNKAIKALSLVGTFVDPNSPTVKYVEAGRRFYVKIEDGDLPILHRLERKIGATIETGGGDRESVACIPLSLQTGIFLSSIATEIGKPTQGDGTLQVVGGDRITTKYHDNNTKAGERDVLRTETVEVVSTAALTFTMGTYESQAPAAFIGQPLHLVLQDVDLDLSDRADKALVKITSRYKVEASEAAGEEMTAELTFRAEEQYRVRDEVIAELTELGDAPTHTGRFASSVSVQGVREDQPVSKNDSILSCAVGDEVVATYIDDLHIGGRSQRIARARISVAGEITSRLGTSVNFVPDPILRAKKNLVEATAFLELARIFASMGLKKGAETKAADGLERVDAIIRMESPIPSSLKEEAFKLRWNLYIAMEDYRQAMATCRLFNRLYPDSPFVDQAMMGIGNIHLKDRDYRRARMVFGQILRLPSSMVKAEAQFRIAQTTEMQAKERADAAAARKGESAAPNAGLTEQAIRQYKLCAERFGESQYAGESLGKLVDYYLDSRDYPRADDLLEQIFQDYPDGNFLDSMLLKWVYVAYRTGNHKKAHDKCTQLIFEYPASPHAKKAKELLPAIKSELEKGAAAGKEKGAS